MSLTVCKQPGIWTQWRVVRSDEGSATVALIERGLWPPTRWTARRLVSTTADEREGIDSILDRFNGGLLISAPGEPLFCTSCAKSLNAAPRELGDGRFECSECRHVLIAPWGLTARSTA